MSDERNPHDGQAEDNKAGEAPRIDQLATAVGDRKAPSESKLVDGVHPYPLTQPLPAKTQEEPTGMRMVGTVEASRLENTAEQQERDRALLEEQEKR